MDYFEVIKKAYQITLKNKFLWIFGIFVGTAAGLNFNFDFSGLANIFNYQLSSEDLSSTTAQTSYDSFYNAIAPLIPLIVTIAVIVIFFVIVIMILSIISQGGLIGSVRQIDKGEYADFKYGFSIGWSQFWRILATRILYFSMFLASLIVWLGPVIIWVISEIYYAAIFWGVIFLFICLAFWILIKLISPYSFQVIVLDKLGIWESIRESLHFFRKHWVQIVVILLLLLAIGIGFSLVLTLGVLIIGGLFLLVFFGIYLASSIAAIIFGIIAILALVFGVIIASAVYKAFNSAVITLTYINLKKIISPKNNP